MEVIIKLIPFIKSQWDFSIGFWIIAQNTKVYLQQDNLHK